MTPAPSSHNTTLDDLLGGSHQPAAGPRWRVAVVHDQPPARRHLADQTVHQLRAAGSMAVEIDASGHDPFADIDSHWRPAIDADAYDLVVSLGRLHATAVTIAALAGIPLATITRSLDEPLPVALETAATRAHLRVVPALDVVTDDTRQITIGPVEITVTPGATASGHLHSRDRATTLDATGWSIHPLTGPHGQLLVTTHHDDAVHQGSHIEITTSDTAALTVEINTRARHALTATVTSTPSGLHLLDLHHPTQPRTG